MTGNCFFVSINDEFEEISYLKHYQSVFNREMCEFIDYHLLQKEIEGDFSQKILRLKFDEYYESRLNSLKIKRKEELDIVHSMKQSKSRDKKRMFMKS